MHKKRFTISCMVMAVILFAFLPLTSATDDTLAAGQLTELAAKIRTGETLDIREEAAKHLADLTALQPLSIDDRTFSELVSLLDSPEDPVRLWVAVALGNFGSHAKAAISKLEERLPEVDCLPGDLTSADAIRYALTKMDRKPPPPMCGRVEASDILFKQMLARTIATLRKAETADIRARAAQHVPALINWISHIDRNKVDDQSVADLVSVLNAFPEIPVRYPIVTALAGLESRAKAAIPDLLQILAEEDCAKETHLGVSLEDDVRHALRKIGLKSPPSPCGRAT